MSWVTQLFNGGKSNTPQRPEAKAPNLQYSTSLPTYALKGKTRADIIFADSQRYKNADFDRNILETSNSVVANNTQTRFNYDLANPQISQCKTFLGLGCGMGGLQKSITSAVNGFFVGGTAGAIGGFAAGEDFAPTFGTANRVNIPNAQQTSTAKGPVIVSDLERAIMALFTPNNGTNKIGTPPFVPTRKG